MTTYTKVPNDILDSMADLKPAAFKLALALCRLTYGYHRDKIEISQNKLSEFTGLSRQGVLNATAEISHLFVCLVEDKKTSWVVNSVYNPCKVSVHPLSTEFTSNGTHSVQVTSGLKKLKENIKETTKESGDGSDSVSIGEIYTAYEDSIAVLDPIVSDLIQAAYEEFGGRLVKEAIVIAVTANKRSWRYVNGILKKWRTDGKNNSRPMVIDETGGFHV